MKCVSFSFKHWQYPLLLSFLTFFQNCLGFHIIRNFSTRNGMIVSMLSSLSSFLFIILEVISYFLRRRHISSFNPLIDSSSSTRYFSTNLFLQVEDEENKKKVNVKLILFLLLLALVSVLPNTFIIFYIYNQLTFFANIQTFLGTIATWAIAYCFIKRKLFRHQILGLVIILIDLIVYFSVLFNEVKGMIIELYINFGLFALLFLLYIIPSASREAIEKNLMQIHFMSPFLLLFLEGVLSIIMLILISLSIPHSLCKSLFELEAYFYADICKSSRWSTLIHDVEASIKNNTVPLLWILGYIVIAFVTNLVRINTNKKLSPTHKYTSEMFCSFYYIALVRLFDLFKFDINFVWIASNKYIITELVHLPFVIVACFIYNENLIIRKWDLDKDTSSEISDRAIKETEALMKVFNEGVDVIGYDDSSEDESVKSNQPNNKVAI